jgi:outer membrane cobalamin receptor
MLQQPAFLPPIFTRLLKNSYRYYTAAVSCFRQQLILKSAPGCQVGFPLLIVTAVLLNLTSLSSQQGGRIYGTVSDQQTGRPVESVSVYLQPVSYGVETGSDGCYELNGIPAGTYQIVISRIGYRNISNQNITINAGSELEFDFSLQPTILSDGEGIVITATRNPSFSNSLPASVDILDRVKFEHQQPENLAEVLNNLPGLQIKDYGGLSGIKSISMRGSSAEQVLVLLDGQRLNSAQSGQVDFGSLSACGIERVEIVHGGNSALYGADAVGGVVNLITGREYIKPGLGASFNMMQGSFNTRSLQGTLQLKKEKYSTDLSYHVLRSRGDFEYTDLNGQKQKRENNDLFSQDLFARANFEFGDLRLAQKLNLAYKFYYTEKGSPGALSYPSRTSRLYNRTDQINAQYSRKLFNALTDLNVQGYAHFGWNRFNSYDYSVHDENSSHNGTYGLEAHIKTIESAAQQTTFGLGTRYDWMKGSNFPSDHSRVLYYLFIQDEIEYGFADKSATPSVRLIPALRFDVFSDFGSHLSPKIGSLIRLGTSWDIAIKANSGFVYRAPIFNELYWPEDDWTKGNPHLRAESGYDWDLGLRLLPAELVQTTLEFTYFQVSMHDLIVWQFQNQKYIPQNVDRTLSSGIELNAGLKPLNDVVFINYNYTYLSAVDQKTHNILPYRPRHTGNLSLILSWMGFKLELQSQSVSSTYADADNKQKLDPYTIYNLIFSARLPLKPVEPRLSVQVNNLQDRRHQIIQNYPLPGREVRLNLGVAF